MPYQRRYQRTYKRRPYYRRRRRASPSRMKIYGAAGSQLYKDVAKLKNLINVEFKAVDTDFTGPYTVTSLGRLTLLNGLTKGDDFNNRDGRQVRFKSLEFNATIYQDATAPHNCILRQIIFIDKQPNGATPLITDVLDSASINALKNLDNRKRFVILKDQFHKLIKMTDDNASPFTEQNSKHVKQYRQLDMKTVYDASNLGDITDITTNAIYMLWISNRGSDFPYVAGTARLRFIDN